MDIEELLEECGIEELYGMPALPQTEPIYADKVKRVKDRLEELYRKVPEEFHRRKSLIQQAIKERKKGSQGTMPALVLSELESMLDFANRL